MNAKRVTNKTFCIVFSNSTFVACAAHSVSPKFDTGSYHDVLPPALAHFTILYALYVYNVPGAFLRGERPGERLRNDTEAVHDRRLRRPVAVHREVARYARRIKKVAVYVAQTASTLLLLNTNNHCVQSTLAFRLYVAKAKSVTMIFSLAPFAQ